MMPYNINDYQPFREGIIRLFRLLKMGADTSEITQNDNMFGTLRWMEKFSGAQERNGAIIFFSMMKQQPLITSN